MSSRTRVDNVDLAAAVASDTITVASTQVAEVTNIGDRVIYSAASSADPLAAPTERIGPGETVVWTESFKLGSPIERCKAQVKFVTVSVPASVASGDEAVYRSRLPTNVADYAILADGNDWTAAFAAADTAAALTGHEIYVPPGTDYEANIELSQGVRLYGRYTKRQGELTLGTKITGIAGAATVKFPEVDEGSEHYTRAGVTVEGLHLVAATNQDAISMPNGAIGFELKHLYLTGGRAGVYMKGFIQEGVIEDVEIASSDYGLYKPTGTGSLASIDRFDKIRIIDLYTHGQDENGVYIDADSSTGVTWEDLKVVTAVKDGVFLAGDLEEWVFNNPTFEANGYLGVATKVANRTGTVTAASSTLTASSATGLAAQQAHVLAGAGGSGQDLVFYIGDSYTPGSTSVPMTTSDFTTPLAASTSVTAAEVTKGLYSDVNFSSGSSTRIVFMVPSFGLERGANDNQLRYAMDMTAATDVVIIGGKSTRPVYARYNKVDVSRAERVVVRRAGTTDASSRYVEYGNAVPLVGSHNKGDVIWNNDPSTVGWAGWVCTVAGNPGTWVKFGATWAINSKTHDFGSIADGANESTTIAVTGAVAGDFAQASFSAALPVGCWLDPQVTAADTVTVTLHNESGSTQDIASGTLRARAERRG